MGQLQPSGARSDAAEGLLLGETLGLEKRFTCTNPACGWYGDADWNAAQNLTVLGLNLSQPRGPRLHCELQGSQKSQSLQDWVA
jgi:hypothetical protein